MLTGKVTVWKIAVISQDGLFFVTAQKAYEVQAYKGKGDAIVFPRFATHGGLSEILAGKLVTSELGQDLPPKGEFVQEGAILLPAAYGPREGIVDRWYDARNMGAIITARGPARVHWRDVPMRPRRRFLVPGEIVSFTSLGKPPDNPATEHHSMRRSRFKLQAYGITLCEKVAELAHLSGARSKADKEVSRVTRS